LLHGPVFSSEKSWTFIFLIRPDGKSRRCAFFSSAAATVGAIGQDDERCKRRCAVSWRLIVQNHADMRDARFLKGFAHGLKAVPGVEFYGLKLGVEIKVVKIPVSTLGQHEAQQLGAKSLTTPVAAYSQALQPGRVGSEMKATAGNGFAVDFSQHVQAGQVVLVHFRGTGDFLLFHEDNSPNHEHSDQVCRSFNASELEAAGGIAGGNKRGGHIKCYDTFAVGGCRLSGLMIGESISGSELHGLMAMRHDGSLIQRACDQATKKLPAGSLIVMHARIRSGPWSIEGAIR
jgi:hypothetical protein